MAHVLKPTDIFNYVIDKDTACLSIKDEKFILDYDTLMETLIGLADLASQMERREPTDSDSRAYQQ